MRALQPKTALFAITLFLSAALMFTVQPMVGKMMLPLFGGAPSVWLAAMVFFQVALLGGYFLAFVFSKLDVRKHILIVCGLLACGLFFLPVKISDLSTGLSGPTAQALSVILVLAACISLPFLGLSMLSPSLQRLFGSSVDKKDPYFLFAASNLGSFGGLLAYPLGLEKYFGLAAQAHLWRLGFAALVMLVVLCWLSMRKTVVVSDQANVASLPARTQRRDIVLWVLLAFIPSALMYGVTAIFTADVGGVPLFWVLPLGLYLLTFVMAFAVEKGRNPIAYYAQTSIVAFALLILPLAGKVMGKDPATLAFLSLVAFTVLARLFHGMLADRRPDIGDLTKYYLWVSVGGALGGVFSVFIVPYVFTAPIEYLVLCFLSLLVLPALARSTWRRPTRLELWGFFGVFVAVEVIRWVVPLTWPLATLYIVAAVLLPLSLSFIASRSVLTTLFVVLLAVAYPVRNAAIELDSVRNFFGLMRVSETTQDGVTVRKIVHGTTLHGIQQTTPTVSLQPGSYYSPVGPALDKIKPANVGLIGLGAGVLNCYTAPSRHYTIYEIDPDVVTMANRWFTYLSSCGHPAIIVGDGRKMLESYVGAPYDAFIVDAFSSDSIPVHLLTAEALHLYFDKMTDKGVLLLHISNNYFDLVEPIAAIATHLNLSGAYIFDEQSAPEKGQPLLFSSRWVLLARDPSIVSTFRADGWRALPVTPTRAWTDDYSYPLSALKLLKKRENDAQTY